VLTGYGDFAVLKGLLTARGLSDPESGKILGINALRLTGTGARRPGYLMTASSRPSRSWPGR
jgi:hypothetical protein